MIQELKELGLKHYEAKVLNVLLMEKLDIRKLSKKAGVPFGKIYSIIKNLKEKNIVGEDNSRPKLVYVEDASGIIGSLIKEKIEKERQRNEKLREFVNGVERAKGNETKFFQIGVTLEDNKRIQMRSFLEAEEEVLQILNIHHKPSSNRENKLLWEKEIKKTVDRGVIFKAIYPEDAELPKILKELNEKYPRKFQVRKINTNFPRCDITDKRKVLIKLVHQDSIQFGGVLFIEDERLAGNLAKIFYQLWES